MAGEITIDQERCKGCDLCIITCPYHFIEKAGSRNRRGHSTVAYKEGASCPGKGCFLCAIICPHVAIEVFKENEEEKR